MKRRGRRGLAAATRKGASPRSRTRSSFVFDLDGTLVDSVYLQVMSWRAALAAVGRHLPAWRIHRRIGMSGELIAEALMRENGEDVTALDVDHVRDLQRAAYQPLVRTVKPLPGARELLAHLTRAGVPWAIATSGRLVNARHALAALGVGADAVIVTREAVECAKPDPGLFLAAADRLGVPPGETLVVGDSVWDLLAARRAGALGVGLLCGGSSREALEHGGAIRVYEEPAELLRCLSEVA